MIKAMRVSKRARNHKIIISVFLVLSVACGTTLALFIIAPKSPSKTNGTAAIATSENISSQPLQYEFVKTSDTNAEAIRYIYYTAEMSDDKLILINDRIIADLTKTGKISKKTNVYYIDYFSNKESASTYFEKIADQNLSPISRLKLISSYTASMSYSKSMNINQLFSISKGKIIKQYKG